MTARWLPNPASPKSGGENVALGIESHRQTNRTAAQLGNLDSTISDQTDILWNVIFQTYSPSIHERRISNDGRTVFDRGIGRPTGNALVEIIFKHHIAQSLGHAFVGTVLVAQHGLAAAFNAENIVRNQHA